MNTQISYKLRIGDNIIEGISTENNTDTAKVIKRLVSDEITNILNNISLSIEKDGKEYNIFIDKSDINKVRMVTRLDSSTIEGIRKKDLIIKPFDKFHLAMEEFGIISNYQIKDNLKTFGYIDNDKKYTEKGKKKRKELMSSPLPNKTSIVYKITHDLCWDSQTVIREWAINKNVIDKDKKITDVGKQWIRDHIDKLFTLTGTETYKKWLLQFLTLGELASFLTHDNKSIREEAVYYYDLYTYGQSVIDATADGNIELVKKLASGNSSDRLLKALYMIADCDITPYIEIQKLLVENIEGNKISIGIILKSKNMQLISIIVNTTDKYYVTPDNLIEAIKIDCTIETIAKLTGRLGYWSDEVIITAVEKEDADILKVVLTKKQGKVNTNPYSILPNDIQQILTEHNDKY